MGKVVPTAPSAANRQAFLSALCWRVRWVCCLRAIAPKVLSLLFWLLPCCFLTCPADSLKALGAMPSWDGMHFPSYWQADVCCVILGGLWCVLSAKFAVYIVEENRLSILSYLWFALREVFHGMYMSLGWGVPCTPLRRH